MPYKVKQILKEQYVVKGKSFQGQSFRFRCPDSPDTLVQTFQFGVPNWTGVRGSYPLKHHKTQSDFAMRWTVVRGLVNIRAENTMILS